MRLVRLTPFAREEFEQSYIFDGDPIEQARRTLFRAASGYATGAQGKYGTGFRNNTTRSHSTPADNWRDFPSALEQIIERLRGVVIENKPAVDLVDIFDGPDTLFYCDPPYPFATRAERSAGDVYRHEMTDDDHRELASTLHACQGAVIVSGYACDLYDQELYPDWQTVDRDTYADGARARVERLWISPSARAATLPLFQLGTAP